MEQRVWDERELVRRCKEGSEAAYAELVRQHRQRLLNLAARLTNSPHLAEDVVQETFLAAFRSMERFEPRPSVGAWLNAICVRLSSRAVSRSPARRDDSLDRMLDADASGDPGRPAGALLADGTPGVDPHAAAEAAEIRRAVAVAIGELPFKQRTAVVLRYVVGLDYADAARTMDVPLNTYKSHLLRGTRALREALDALAPTGVVDAASAAEVRRLEAGASDAADAATAAAAAAAAREGQAAS